MARFFRLFLLALLVALLAAPAAHAKDWQVLQTHSKLSFHGSFQDDPFTGVFKQFDARIAYDAQQLDQARFDVTVQLASEDTQSRMRDEALQSEAFFAVKKHPTAHFVADDFEQGADGQVLAHGTLELKGITKPVTLRVDFQPTEQGATLEAATTVKRLDFELGASDDWAEISQNIDVTAHLQLR